jgi:NAD(P)-dependent dehydrogenase (short-subunit alcohol dehydrogenase family)
MTVLDSFDLSGKVAVVTGGNRGLGRAMAQALGEAGATVAITSRTRASAEVAAQELTDLGITAFGLDLEVTVAADVDRAVAEITRALGPIDVLLNNAGISIPAPAFEIDDADWRSVFATNVDGLWFCSRAVARQMAERGGGSIINVGSMSATIVNRPLWQPAYLASKAAVHQLTKALAAEWAPSGIRVNAIAPGYFLTEMSPVDQPQFKEWCVDPAAMKRFGLPPELGAAAVFLAGGGSSFMTGSVVTIDGGFTVF